MPTRIEKRLVSYVGLMFQVFGAWRSSAGDRYAADRPASLAKWCSCSWRRCPHRVEHTGQIGESLLESDFNSLDVRAAGI